MLQVLHGMDVNVKLMRASRTALDYVGLGLCFSAHRTSNNRMLSVRRAHLLCHTEHRHELWQLDVQSPLLCFSNLCIFQGR